MDGQVPYNYFPKKSKKDIRLLNKNIKNDIMLQSVFESWNVLFSSYDFWSITKVEHV